MRVRSFWGEGSLYNIGYMKGTGLWWLSLFLGMGPVEAAGELPSYTASPSAQVTYSITPTPTTKALPKLPFIAPRLNCQELLVTGDGQAVPAKVAFEVRGTGGDEVKYKIEFGDGEIYEGSTPTVTHTYLTPGTLTAKGFVLDKSNLLDGGQGLCQKTVKVFAAELLTTQPQTGPSAWFWGVILMSGISGGWLYFWALRENNG